MDNASRHYNVIVSQRTAEQLVSHVRFVALVSGQAAERLRLDVLEAVASLQVLPERNPWLVDPMLPVYRYRKMPIGNRYLLIYQIKEDTVYVDNIVDCRQDYQWLL